MPKSGREHMARKALFTKGIRRGFLTLKEIGDALPSGSLSDAERWLLFYSLQAALVEVRDSDGHLHRPRRRSGARSDRLVISSTSTAACARMDRSDLDRCLARPS